MIATSVLLSACVLAHTDEETSASLIDRLINKDAPTVDAVDESTEQRRLTPPEMGVEGGPCRTGMWYTMFGQRCNWGLHCDYARPIWTGDSATYGVCTQYGNPGWSGNANQPCNRSGPRCNHSNLRPRWEHGEFCTCEYFLGEASPESSTQDQATTSTADDSTRLGMRAPQMGGEGEPCRNTRGDECNYGLHCHYSTRDGSSIQGRCRRNPAPAPTPRPDHHNTGYAGERCNPAPYSPCNNDNLKPEYHQLYPSGTSCVCTTVDPEPRVGEAGGRCNRAPYSPCNSSNLAPRYHQLLPSGYSCTCEYLLQ